MLRLSNIFFFCVLSVYAHAGIFYSDADSINVPHQQVVAVEARAKHPGGNWEVLWPGVVISVEPAASQFVDGVDEPAVRLVCGAISAVAQGIDCYKGYFTIAIEWDSYGNARILAGHDSLKEVMAVDALPRPDSYVKVTHATDVAEIIVETCADTFDALATSYTPDDLLAAKIWRFLDRENDPKVALLGGEYVLAQIGNDLVYLAGARINAPHWRTGMLKARLVPTGYVGYFRLIWYDATGRRLADDTYAQFDDAASTATFVFPALQASLRFSSLGKGGVAVGVE